MNMHVKCDVYFSEVNAWQQWIGKYIVCFYAFFSVNVYHYRTRIAKRILIL